MEGQQHKLDLLVDEIFGKGPEAELIRGGIREALGATRRVRQKQRCPSCKTEFRGEYSAKDPAVVQKMIEWLADRLAGRPGVQKDQDVGEIIFVNKTVLVDADGEETLSWLAERGLLAKPLADAEAEWELAHTTPPDAAEKFAALKDAEA